MKDGHETRLANEIEGLLGFARRDLLLLSVATQQHAYQRVAAVADRIRSTIFYAQQLASQSVACVRYVEAKLVSIEQAVHTWLPDRLDSYVHDGSGALPSSSQIVPTFLAERVVADNTLLAGFDWDRLALVQMSAQQSTLTRISARQALLDHANLAGSHISYCSMNEARLRAADLSMAKLEESTLTGANLERSRWSGAQVQRCKAARSFFGAARLHNALFEDCDFQYADFQGFVDETNRGLTLIRCDLRGTSWHGRSLAGVSFIECKLHGISGGVERIDRAKFEKSDLSPDGDGKVLVTQEEAVKRWSYDFRAMPASSPKPVH